MHTTSMDNVATGENETADAPNAVDSLLSCGLCAQTMLHPVIGDCGHAIGCLACVETYFEENIKINAKRRKVTRIVCKECNAPFAKPKNKRLCVDHTLGELCRHLRPAAFGPARASNSMDALALAVLDIKRQIVKHPIEGMPKPDKYQQDLYKFLDSQAKSVADLHFCKCTKCIDGWPDGIPVYPKWSSKSGKWYFSCPMWTPTSKEAGMSCSYFQWVGCKDVERFGLI